MRSVLQFLSCIILLSIAPGSNAQFNPITVTGFNQDAIAEGPPSSLATTTLQVDGGSSNRVMYTNAFRVFAGLGGGGLPDNGTIVNGGDTYQLAPYTGNNALYIYRNESFALSIVTPAPFARIRVLAFTTEGASSLNVRCNFSDGSFTDYLTNYALPDWFNGTTNVVMQGIGRCSRVATAPWGDDGYPTNPRLYYIDIPLNCFDKTKNLQSVLFSNFSTVPNNAPFPNAVILAISGALVVPPVITPTITPCDCNGPNGSASIAVNGNAAPYTFFWPTLNLNGPTATNLAPGNYTCNITDANGCVIPYPVTIPMNANGAITAQANPMTICAGEPVTLTINVVNGSYQLFGWQEMINPLPPFILGQTVTVNPTVTTTYRAAAQKQPFTLWSSACDATSFVTVTVNPIPQPPLVNNITACNGSSATLQVQNPQAGVTYNWYNTAAGGTPLASGTSYTVNNVTSNSTYYVEAAGAGNCIATTRGSATITVLQPLPQPVVTLTNTTFTSLTFSWNAIPGATGYEVTTNGGASYQTPSSGPTGTTHTISGLNGNTTIILQVRALGAQACENSILSAPVSGTTLSSKEIFVPNVFTPNNDGRNDLLLVYGNYISAIQFNIFNQWGELIFVSNNSSIGWNGTHKGQQQPVGVYTYTLRVVLQDGTIVNKKGSINLIR
jgi:gliding motility-associated-like protein